MKLSFKKGMTLSEYMQDLKQQDDQNNQDQKLNNNDDLYISCQINHQRQPSTKLIPFNIPEMDEDNYQSSVDNYPQTPVNQSEQNYSELNCQKQTPKFRQNHMRKSQIQITTMYLAKKDSKLGDESEKSRSKDFRVKHQSNSPFKRQIQVTPTKSLLSKTLYGNTFLSNNLDSINTASSTLYQSKLGKQNDKFLTNQQSLKGTIHSRESKKEKYFQNKNKRQLDYLINYENTIRHKYTYKMNLLDIRVDGFKDKLYERKNKIMQ